MKKQLFFILAVVLGLSACHQKGNSFKVNVSLVNSNDKTIYLQKYVDNAPVIIDSAVIANETAVLSAEKDNPQIIYALKIKGMRGSMPFFADNKDVFVVGDIYNPQAIEIMASETQAELDAYYDHLAQLKMQVLEHFQALNKAIEINDSIMLDSLTKVGRMLNDTMNSYPEKYIKQHADQFLAHYILSESKHEYDISYLKELVSNFTTESIYSKELNDYIAKQERLEIGQPFIDFTLKTNEDAEIVLSEMIPKNKFTLVQFWTSWNVNCRLETPFIKAAYEQFHAFGFDVISVGINNNKNEWLQALEEEQMPWTQVLDIENKVKIDYMIYYTPFNFLYDQEGNMIAKGLRGEELTAKLAELLD